MKRAGTWLVHPAIQPYREEIFSLLDLRLQTTFLFPGWYHHNLERIPPAGLRRWAIFADRAVGPYRQGVSAGLVGAAATGRFDVWITTGLNWFPTHVSFPIVKARRKPFVLWTLDWWWPDTRGESLARVYAQRILHAADAVIAGSQRSLQFAVSHGASREKVFYAPETTKDLGTRSWDHDHVSRLRTELLKGQEGFLFLYLNRIVEYKGLDTLLRAFHAVEQAERKAHLAVYGDGPHRFSCERLAADLGLNNVHFGAPVPHECVHLLYRAADMYVHPARFLQGVRVKAEAWGFTVNEAMSVGCPVLATTAVASADDLIVNGDNGVIVPAGRTQALTDAMLEAIGNPALLRQMGKRARRRVRDRFTAEHQLTGFRKALDYVGADTG